MDSVQSPTRESNSAVHRSVLVVDDEENLLLLLDRILSKEGYRVKTAPNSYQALHLLENGGVHLAFLDIKMVSLHGPALLAVIKKRCPSIKMIIITAYPPLDTRKENFRESATTYLNQPPDIHQ